MVDDRGVGSEGPRPRAVDNRSRPVQRLRSPTATPSAIDFGSINARLFRISYVGDFGWEIYVPTEQGQPMWDRLWEAGQDFGVVPVGAGVYGTTGRLEKGYRLMGAELESEYNPVEAGLARATVKPVDFIGQEAYLKARENEPVAVLCTLTVEDHMSQRDGMKRYMTGREPITTPSGGRIVDEKGRPSYVTTAGAGPSVGKYPAAGLPAARAGCRRQRPGRDVHGRALSGEGCSRRLDAALRSRRFANEGLAANRRL